ncbi:MAG TPA: 4-(cytidine 5'-diphospho)-2-C-methyl-D-erythritol kinase [Verrucomicrobiae bacterium]|nr:4-(cytidine 5'-diphospho)-2-C-methyl-D-erythritol kinase [Verrucomicrobiae bacterium]
MTLEKQSPGKVNLLLNILGKRPDGFHELETVMHPINVFDRLTFEPGKVGIQLTCNNAALPINSSNLVYRTATAFLQLAKISDGVRIHLEKTIPVSAGLGGGSGNAATTLLGLNELFGKPLKPEQMQNLAALLGSDVPFFLQNQPAIATGRGEHITPLDFFPALSGKAFVLVHPGFGVATAWAYQQLVHFPDALNGRVGRAPKLVSLLRGPDARTAAAEFYNSLEAPALKKYPLLALFQEFFRAHGAMGTLMSGSGSTTFAVMENQAAAEALVEEFKSHFGKTNWMVIVPV